MTRFDQADSYCRFCEDGRLQIEECTTFDPLCHERQKREAELRALQAQINPHFLYNTLDTINWMARKKGAVEVSGLVQALSKLFRISLSKGKDLPDSHHQAIEAFSQKPDFIFPFLLIKC